MSTPNKQQIKRTNARIQKWREMIKSGQKDPSLIKSRVRKGIPQGIRILAWPQIVSLNKFIEKSPYKYQKLINEISRNTYEISLDVRRTFPQEQDSKYLLKSLNNVLKAISLVYPKIGYCQGMNFLTCRILQILSDEMTFWLLHYCLDHDENLRHLFADPESIFKQNYVFEHLIAQKLEEVSNKLKEQNINMMPFSLKWFIPLFSSILPQQLFNRVFQIYLSEGWTVIYSVGIALLKINQRAILENSFENNFTLLSKHITVTNFEQFIELVLGFNLEKRKIDQLEAQYLKQHEGLSPLKPQVSKRQINNKSYKGSTPLNQSVSYLQIQNKTQAWDLSTLSSLKNNIQL